MSQGILRGAAVVGQSGGPTAVINQSLVGVVETLRGQPGIEQILGCRHGVKGIVGDDFVALHNVPQELLERVAATPSAGLGSSRDKPDAAYCKRIFEAFAKRNVRYFFYIGGNDSSDTCRLVNELARENKYELRCFHVPKTIDNDLMMNDHCPGFASAAKFVAQAFLGDDLDNRSLPGIKINVVMGRHAGFLTAASVLARQHSDSGPHLIYVPEVPFNPGQFVEDVDRVYKQHGRCLIAVSEGIHDGELVDQGGKKKPTEIAVKLAVSQGHHVERDDHGNVALSGSGALGDFLAIEIKHKLGPRYPDPKNPKKSKLRVRADTLGYLQRCFVGCVSEVDQREAREAGRTAARLALSGDIDGSVAIQRVSDSPYKVEYKRIELSDVAAKTRHLDPKWIVGGNDIHPSFKDYLRPLVGEIPLVGLLPRV